MVAADRAGVESMMKGDAGPTSAAEASGNAMLLMSAAC